MEEESRLVIGMGPGERGVGSDCLMGTGSSSEVMGTFGS